MISLQNTYDLFRNSRDIQLNLIQWKWNEWNFHTIKTDRHSDRQSNVLSAGNKLQCMTEQTTEWIQFITKHYDFDDYNL